MLLTDRKRDLETYFLSTFDNYKQFAVGVRSGVEKMFAAVTLALGEPPPSHTPRADLDLSDNVMAYIGMDQHNAFMTVDRTGSFDTLSGIASKHYPGTIISQGDALPSPDLRTVATFFTHLYQGPATFVHHARDSVTDILNTDGFHQGCVAGTLGYALATFPFLGNVLQQDAQVLWFLLVDNTCLVGPLVNTWAMYDRLRIVLEGLHLHLNPRECVLWVPQWSYLPTPPPILNSLRAQYPLSPLTYHPQGFPTLGLPLGTPEFSKAFLTTVSNKIASTLPPISSIPDGRIFLQIMRSCVNLRPHFYLRNLPPSLTDVFAKSCDDALMSTVAAYLAFPIDWRDQPPYIRAVAQIRNPPKQGGLGIPATHSLIHSSFLAGFSITLSWIGFSSL